MKMNKFSIFLLLSLISQYSFALDMPVSGASEIKFINDKDILYIDHRPENGHVSNTVVQLVQYYLLNDGNDFQVVFPQFSVIKGNNEFIAIEYQGNPQEKDNTKVTDLEGGFFYSFTYKGHYNNLRHIIPDVMGRINAEKNYKRHLPVEIRLLYWNSIDDNHPKDLVTEIQVRINKK